MKRHYLLLAFIFFCPSILLGQISFEKEFGELFKEAAMARVFPLDSKTIVDCYPKRYTQEIMEDYNRERQKSGFVIKDFFLENFEIPKEATINYANDGSLSLQSHIDTLWNILLRKAQVQEKNTTLIALPNQYIVPGGRFREIYYWDSYFTMLGLEEAGRYDIIENMLDNFSYLIEKYGFIPNGNRTYFLTRSQPPYFGLMVKLLAMKRGAATMLKYKDALEAEYEFWMAGKDKLVENYTASLRTVRLEEGDILNRYFDSTTKPRPESFHEDSSLATRQTRNTSKLYQDIRSACESGWDFSSRWFADNKTIETIETSSIVPVDLNCLLFELEKNLAICYNLKGNDEKMQMYINLAKKRKESIRKYFWDDEKSFYMDFHLLEKKSTGRATLAGMSPLFSKVATYNQAIRARKTLEDFLGEGGLRTTLIESGEQWDKPNGWAPLQWISIQGLREYGFNDFATTIAKRWIKSCEIVFSRSFKMVEKYNVESPKSYSGGGEYPLQDGFGWTNGVLLKLLKMYPD